MKKSKLVLTVNIVVIVAILILNYFYQSNGYDFTLKCTCSGLFAALGLFNLVVAINGKVFNLRFYVLMALGLVLAMLGDVLIGYDFIVGAGTFALGHVCFVIAYCFLQKIMGLDLVVSGVIFLGALLFLLLCPLLTFDIPVFKIVCIVYALIISTMLGKAIANFLREKNVCTALLALGSALFLFSDLMLVFDWFIGLWDWTSNACMGTYYPALCLMAFAMWLKMTKK